MTEIDIEVERMLAVFNHNVSAAAHGTGPKVEAVGEGRTACLQCAVRLSELHGRQSRLLEQQSLQLRAQTAEIAELRQAVISLQTGSLKIDHMRSALAFATQTAFKELRERIAVLENAVPHGRMN